MKQSFEGFTNKKSCGAGKTNFGNATPENVDNGVKFSSSGYINATGTSTKKKWGSSSGTIYGQSTSPYANLSVSGLTFRPSTVLIWLTDSSGYICLRSYNENMPTNLKNMIYENVRFVSGTTYTCELSTDGLTQINNDGFNFTAKRATTGTFTAYWKAYE
jgi:hypothetical protein